MFADLKLTQSSPPILLHVLLLRQYVFGNADIKCKTEGLQGHCASTAPSVGFHSCSNTGQVFKSYYLISQWIVELFLQCLVHFETFLTPKYPRGRMRAFQIIDIKILIVHNDISSPFQTFLQPRCLLKIAYLQIYENQELSILRMSFPLNHIDSLCSNAYTDLWWILKHR